MSEIESAEAFAERLCAALPSADERCACEVLTAAIRDRDRAIRAAALHVVVGMRSEVDAAKAHLAWRAAGSKGMSATFHGDFASVPTSGLHRLEWWLREFDRALADEAPR